MSKNNTRYEIDVLLQMARITEDAHKKKEYLCTIETLLNCAEVPSEPTYGYSVNVDNSVIEFCDNKQIAGIIGDDITVNQVYKDYISYCDETNIDYVLENKVFGKQICRHLGLYSKPVKVDGRVERRYFKKFYFCWI